MNRIKKYFLDFKNKNYKSQASPERVNASYIDAKTIGILFNAKSLQSIDALVDFVRVLQQDGKQVKALTYYNSKDKDNLKVYNFNHHVISEKDISILGEIKSFLADEFVKTDFDYLFCIDIEPFDVFKNILLHSKAKCRIGKFMEDQMCYELMIKMDENEGTDALIKQMYHYVKTIKNDEK